MNKPNKNQRLLNDHRNNNAVDTQYLVTCWMILENGVKKSNRTGVDTISDFGHNMRFNLQEGFPILTTKKVLWEKAFDEMLWMISGSTKVSDLPKRSRCIWDKWQDSTGSIGDGYGKQMRNWKVYYPVENPDGTRFKLPEHIKEKLDHRNKIKSFNPEFEKFKFNYTKDNRLVSYSYEVDQIKKIQWQIRNEPNNRRIILNLWNVAELESTMLPPCHYTSVFGVQEGKLNCLLVMRSNDMFLGNPFNICGYAMLTHLLAYCCDLQVGTLNISIADAHIYENHLKQIDKQMDSKHFPLPRFEIKEGTPKEITEIKVEHLNLVDYQHGKALKGVVAI